MNPLDFYLKYMIASGVFDNLDDCVYGVDEDDVEDVLARHY